MRCAVLCGRRQNSLTGRLVFPRKRRLSHAGARGRVGRLEGRAHGGGSLGALPRLAAHVRVVARVRMVGSPVVSAVLGHREITTKMLRAHRKFDPQNAATDRAIYWRFADWAKTENRSDFMGAPGTNRTCGQRFRKPKKYRHKARAFSEEVTCFVPGAVPALSRRAVECDVGIGVCSRHVPTCRARDRAWVRTAAALLDAMVGQ